MSCGNEMIKSVYVEELQEGVFFKDAFLVKSIKNGETRTGKPYFILTVMDRSGEVSGPIWDNVEELKLLCAPGEVVQIAGTVASYQGHPQLNIDSIVKVETDTIELSHFLPSAPECREAMAIRLHGLVQGISDPFLRKLLNYFFVKSKWWPRFKEAPAAKGIHHAYIGGLLEHSLSVATIADFMVQHYKGVNRSLLIAGALLHDIGKLEELKVEAGLVQYTVQGRLKGHIVIGSELIGHAARKIDGFPDSLLEQLQHLVVSHHGRQEFGSPAPPMTVEALLLSFLDDLDAKMNITEQLRLKMSDPELHWTDFQRSLERYLYLGGFEQEKKVKMGAGKDGTCRQPSLF